MLMKKKKKKIKVSNAGQIVTNRGKIEPQHVKHKENGDLGS